MLDGTSINAFEVYFSFIFQVLVDFLFCQLIVAIEIIAIMIDYYFHCFAHPVCTEMV